MVDILLSKHKINELKRELASIEESIKDHHEAEHENIKMSYHEAVSFDVTIGSKHARLKELKSIIAKAEVLPDKIKSKKAVLGSWIDVESNENLEKFRLVHPIEADPSLNLLSTESPLGKLFSSKRKGDTFTFNQRHYTVLNIY
ncbi:GreA/GreB family elongation factor [Candidatus Dojkabacteria bacterium]|nr:GreA/GreB family elongation factor [Candidatus Dojkabacteria bacterium]